MTMKDKNRPKSPLSSYACFVQVIREKHRSLNPNENVIFSEFAKKCAEKWREMAVVQRAPFEEMSRLDIKRYNREMGEYVQLQQHQRHQMQQQQQSQQQHSDLPPGGQETPTFGFLNPNALQQQSHPQQNQHARGVKRRRLKDPGMPKRPLSAFFFFCDEHRPKIRTSHPEWKVSDIAKELGHRWEDCSAKEPYEAQAKNDKLRYEEEMRQYRGGAFIGISKRIRVSTPSGSGVAASSFEIEGSREADEMDRKGPDDEEEVGEDDEDDDEEDNEDDVEEEREQEEAKVGYEKMDSDPNESLKLTHVKASHQQTASEEADGEDEVGDSYPSPMQKPQKSSFSVAFVSGSDDSHHQQHNSEVENEEDDDEEDDDDDIDDEEEESGILVVDEN